MSRERIVSALTVRILQFARLQVVINLYTELPMNIGWWSYIVILHFRYYISVLFINRWI